jgi:hypothetical protein
MLKSPVQERCESAGLAGCPQIAEGVVLYADGKQAEGADKLKAGAAANNPDEVREFAKKLTTVTSLPGVDQYAGPVRQVAALLATEAAAATAMSSANPTPAEAARPVAQVAEAHVDPKTGETPNTAAREKASPVVVQTAPPIAQVVTETTHAWFGRDKCMLFGKPVSCQPIQQGPFIVTDVVALPGCDDEIYVGVNLRENASKNGYAFKWVVLATHPGMHGTFLAVQPGETLIAAVATKNGGASEDPRCAVSWSGHRPIRGTQGERAPNRSATESAPRKSPYRL